MHVNFTQEGSRVVISLEGDLDFTTRDGFESELRRIIGRADNIVLDLGRLRFIDSSGVAVLLSSCEDASLAGVAVRIRNVAQDLMEIFEMIGVKSTLPFE